MSTGWGDVHFAQNADSKDYYDTDKFMLKVLERDLKMVFNRRRFTRLLSDNFVDARLPIHPMLFHAHPFLPFRAYVLG